LTLAIVRDLRLPDCAIEDFPNDARRGWEGVLKPAWRAIAARSRACISAPTSGFANPEVDEYLEAESIKYAIRLPANPVLQERIGHLLTRPVGRPPNKCAASTRTSPIRPEAGQNPAVSSPADVKAAAREMTPQALGTLQEIMEDKKAPPAARVTAATAILDRGWGKPKQSIEAETRGAFSLANLVAMSVAQREAEAEADRRQAIEPRRVGAACRLFNILVDRSRRRAPVVAFAVTVAVAHAVSRGSSGIVAVNDHRVDDRSAQGAVIPGDESNRP